MQLVEIKVQWPYTACALVDGATEAWVTEDDAVGCAAAIRRACEAAFPETLGSSLYPCEPWLRHATL